MEKIIQSRPKPLHQTYIALGIWAIVILLFLQQFYFSISNKNLQEILTSAMFLIFIFMAIPAVLLLIYDWVKYLAQQKQAKWINYFLFVAFIYGFGYLIDLMIEKEISFLPLKMVVFAHLIILSMALSYFIIFILPAVIVNWLAEMWYKKTGKTFNGKIIYALFMLMIFQAIKMVNHNQMGNVIVKTLFDAFNQ